MLVHSGLCDMIHPTLYPGKQNRPQAPPHRPAPHAQERAEGVVLKVLAIGRQHALSAGVRATAVGDTRALSGGGSGGARGPGRLPVRRSKGAVIRGQIGQESLQEREKELPQEQREADQGHEEGPDQKGGIDSRCPLALLQEHGLGVPDL